MPDVKFYATRTWSLGSAEMEDLCCCTLWKPTDRRAACVADSGSPLARSLARSRSQGGGGRGVVNLSIAPIGIVRRMIRAIVTSQVGQVWKLKWLSNNHIARSLSRVVIQKI